MNASVGGTMKQTLYCKGEQSVKYQHKNLGKDECKQLDQQEIPGLARTSDRSISSASSQSLCDLDEHIYASIKLDSSPVMHNTSAALEDFGRTTNTSIHEQPIIHYSKVHWGTVEMKLFPIIPGDHPDCVQGPPVSNSLFDQTQLSHRHLKLLTFYD
jgi:hypothetical protein